MRKKIYIGLCICSLIFIMGGFYITGSIGNVIASLRNVIILHQVEILREDLLNKIKVVQSDLLLKDSPHERDLNIFVEHVDNMEAAINGCFDCHHVEATQELLVNLRLDILAYEKTLSRIYTMRANLERISREREKALTDGQRLLHAVDRIVVTSSEKLSQQTNMVLADITGTRKLITILVVGGPILALIIVTWLVRNFSNSFTTLLHATRRIRNGDLQHRITGLKDEFGVLAESFNEMSASLVEQIHRIGENQKRYQLLFESAGDAIFILEAEGEDAGRIVAANRAASEMNGYTVEELLRMRIQDIDCQEDAAKAGARIRRILAGERVNCEVCHRRKDGTELPVEASAGLLEFEGRKFILAFDRDITERKLAEETLQRAKQMVIVGEMAAGLAHEIKNPLAGIKLSIQILSSELELDEENREIFRLVVQEINRIETLLRDMLNYARPSKPEFSPVDLNQLLKTGIKSARMLGKVPENSDSAFNGKKIEFKEKLDPALPPVTADFSQLQQVFLNLLINAIEASRETGTIMVESCRGSNGMVRVCITDTGKGADEKVIEQLFKPFFTTKPKGTGLGLAICRRLIEQHRGSIAAVNNPEGGMIFTIELPVEQNGVPTA